MESQHRDIRNLFEYLEADDDPFEGLFEDDHEDEPGSADVSSDAQKPGYLHNPLLGDLPDDIRAEALQREVVEMEFWLEFHLHAGDLKEVGTIARHALAQLKSLLGTDDA